MNRIIGLFLLILASSAAADEWSYNLFRSPSIGPEYRRDQISFHLGFYITVLTPIGTTPKSTWFIRAGASSWRQPEKDQAAYAGLSCVYGLTGTWQNTLGILPELGVRSYFSRTEQAAGQVRLGVSALISPSQGVFVRPNPGLGYSRFGKQIHP